MGIGEEREQRAREAIAWARRRRRFPDNTCPSSRHAQMIGEALAKGENYYMLANEPKHCGGSILVTVGALYAARTKIARLEARLPKRQGSKPKVKTEGLEAKPERPTRRVTPHLTPSP